MAKKDWEKMSKHDLMKHNQDCEEVDCKFCDELAYRLQEEENRAGKTDATQNRLDDQEGVITNIDLDEIQKLVDETADEESLSLLHAIKTTVDELSTTVYELKDTLHSMEYVPEDEGVEQIVHQVTEFRVEISDAQLEKLSNMVVDTLTKRMSQVDYKLVIAAPRAIPSETRKTLVAKK